MSARCSTLGNRILGNVAAVTNGQRRKQDEDANALASGEATVIST
jgi:hypothetical protein